jgi:hypothetical protein
MAVALTLGNLGASAPSRNAALQLRVHRWLEVQWVQGEALIERGQRPEPARVGATLQTVGEGIQTGSNGRVRLVLDTNGGSVELAEDTRLIIQTIQPLADGNSLIELRLEPGQVGLRAPKGRLPLPTTDAPVKLPRPAEMTGLRGACPSGLPLGQRGVLAVQVAA